jgi:colicin import membrane protein
MKSYSGAAPRVQISLNQDGSLATAPLVLNPTEDFTFNAVLETGLAAIQRCNPLKIPAAYSATYPAWREVIITFDVTHGTRR